MDKLESDGSHTVVISIQACNLWRTIIAWAEEALARFRGRLLESPGASVATLPGCRKYGSGKFVRILLAKLFQRLVKICCWNKDVKAAVFRGPERLAGFRDERQSPGTMHRTDESG